MVSTDIHLLQSRMERLEKENLSLKRTNEQLKSLVQSVESRQLEHIKKNYEKYAAHEERIKLHHNSLKEIVELFRGLNKQVDRLDKETIENREDCLWIRSELVILKRHLWNLNERREGDTKPEYEPPVKLPKLKIKEIKEEVIEIEERQSEESPTVKLGKIDMRKFPPNRLKSVKRGSRVFTKEHDKWIISCNTPNYAANQFKGAFPESKFINKISIKSRWYILTKPFRIEGSRQLDPKLRLQYL